MNILNSLKLRMKMIWRAFTQPVTPELQEPQMSEKPEVVTDSKKSYIVNKRKNKRVNAKSGTKVLVIDDSKTILGFMRKLLTQNGYNVFEAADAETGVELAKKEIPDLIFLDIVLPGMNGFAALRLLRKDPQLSQVPVLMMSGNIQATEEFYMQKIGADDFLKKPFSRAEVCSRIETLLDENSIPKRPNLEKVSEA